MLNNLPVVAIIPVRGGSKGIPGKNLYRLGKDTLLERTIKQAQRSKYIDKVIVSTDDEEMYEIACKYNVQTPEPRPDPLANDTAKTVDVVLHTLHEQGIDDVYVCLLQVTSPLRRVEDIDAALGKFENSPDAQAVVSLAHHDDPHPDKIQKISGGYVNSYLGVESMVARQLLPEVYRLNGSLYLTHSSILMDEKTFVPANTVPYVMPADRSVNLDTMYDLYLLESLVEKGVVTIEEY